MAIGRFLLAWRRSRGATLVAHPHSPHRMKVFSSALLLLMTSGFLVACTYVAIAWIGLLYFRATPHDNSILLEWETATEQDTAAFGLYRSLDEGSLGQSLALFPAQGGPVSGASYSYRDANVVAGVLYYYALQEVTSSGGTIIVARANAGIGVPTPAHRRLLPHPRLPTPSSTPTPTPTPRPKLYLPLVLR